MKNNVAVLLMCATTIIMVAGIAYGVTNYWNENISGAIYDNATESIQEKCWRELDGDADFSVVNQVNGEKNEKVVTFTCIYKK